MWKKFILMTVTVLLFSQTLWADSKNVPWVNGEVKRVVKASNTIVVKHEEIAHIGMSAMTMPFKVKETSLLDNLKAGDKIKFTVVEENQDLVITQIKPQ
jgi:Cu/Ag efflux protein CusF